MKSAKPLPPLEELARCYRVNNDCPSGLERIGSPTRKSGALGPLGASGRTVTGESPTEAQAIAFTALYGRWLMAETPALL